MANEAKKTEHSGPKKGRGAYGGRRVAAKKDSNRKRWENDKASVQQTVRPEYGLIKTDDCFVIGFGMEINGFFC